VSTHSPPFFVVFVCAYSIPPRPSRSPHMRLLPYLLLAALPPPSASFLLHLPLAPPTRLFATTPNDFHSLTVPSLKSLLRAEKLPVSGVKTVLIDRLLKHHGASLTTASDTATNTDSLSTLGNSTVFIRACKS